VLEEMLKEKLKKELGKKMENAIQDRMKNLLLAKNPTDAPKLPYDNSPTNIFQTHTMKDDEMQETG
jgi:hypothetical protein